MIKVTLIKAQLFLTDNVLIIGQGLFEGLTQLRTTVRGQEISIGQ